MSTKQVIPSEKQMSIDQALALLENVRKVEYSKDVNDIYTFIHKRKQNLISLPKVMGVAAAMLGLLGVNLLFVSKHVDSIKTKSTQQIVKGMHLETNNDIYHE